MNRDRFECERLRNFLPEKKRGGGAGRERERVMEPDWDDFPPVALEQLNLAPPFELNWGQLNGHRAGFQQLLDEFGRLREVMLRLLGRERDQARLNEAPGWECGETEKD